MGKAQPEGKGNGSFYSCAGVVKRRNHQIQDTPTAHRSTREARHRSNRFCNATLLGAQAFCNASRLHADVQLPKCEVSHFAQGVKHSQRGIRFDRTFRNWRPVGRDSKSGKHNLDAIQMKPITHRDARVGLELVQDLSGGPNALISGLASRFHKDFGRICAFLNQVITSHASFRKMPVTATAARRNDPGSKASLFEIESVVEPVAIHGGRIAVKLCRAHHHNRAGAPRLLGYGLSSDRFVERPLGKYQHDYQR